jgi:glycosyltransferase involved in cell wall biosynthesis
MVRVSILIATRNYGAYIEECLDSVAAQRFKDIELIVYDDASTDGTDVIVRQWFDDNQIDGVYRRGRMQSGQSRAKNKALAYSEGEYIFFLDADNKFSDERCLETFVDHMDKNPDAGFVYCDRVAFGTAHGIIKSHKITDAIYNGNYVDGNMLSRRSAFGEYDEKLVKFTDWDRVLHMLTSGWNGIYLPVTLIHYRFHDTNTGTVHANRNAEMHAYIVGKYDGKKVKL